MTTILAGLLAVDYGMVGEHSRIKLRQIGVIIARRSVAAITLHKKPYERTFWIARAAVGNIVFPTAAFLSFDLQIKLS